MEKTITDFLDSAVRRFPDKIAFADNKNSLTYREIQTAAFKIAQRIIDYGYFKKPVVILMEKTAGCISAFMGVSYSGNFYSPLDSKMPAERIRRILETLDPVMIIADQSALNLAREVSQDKDIAILSYEEMMEGTYSEPAICAVRDQIIDTDVCYVLFTSGSTGVPKGVIIPHKGVITYACWASETFHFDETLVLGNQTPFYFSMSIFDIFQTLINGGTMYIIPKMLFSFPVKLLDYINEHEINTIYWVPSALSIVANRKALEKRTLPGLKNILFAGEVMPAKQFNMWRRALPHAMFANLFGPTEVTDICNYYIVEREISDTESIPIGGACQNTGILILNEQNQEVKGTEVGELCVRGSELAYGYYNNPEKTKEAFVQNPLNPYYPETIYRTGDLVHYNEAGELIYNSRKDFQIKHMGHRIELGEIETAVSSLEGVSQNCCLYDTEKQQIVVFMTANLPLSEKDVDTYLKSRLPAYMIPGRIAILDEMPLNLNGKIDRVRLKQQLKEGAQL